MIRPFPKPPSMAKKKPQRLPRREAVTMIAGFKSQQGIVLCADTQETIGHYKRHVQKLRVEPSMSVIAVREHLGGSDLAMGFCGAGEGPFTDKLGERAWLEAQKGACLDEVCSRVETGIKTVYQEFGQIYQPGLCPSSEFIFGIKMKGESRLFTADGPVVNETNGYTSRGAGYYMADFLAARMYQNGLSLYQCIVIAAYVLAQAKQHVDGCGGESQIAVLRNEGISGLVGSKPIEGITKVLEWTDRAVGGILLHAANLELSPKEFQDTLPPIVEALETIREHQKEKLEQWNNFWKAFAGGGECDSLGLPKLPSTFQKSEPGQ